MNSETSLTSRISLKNIAINTDALINAVYMRRPIWDKKHEHFTHRELNDALWNEIALMLDISAREARAKWKNLKDAFRREAKKVASENHKSKWRFYQPLTFLYDAQIENDEDKHSLHSNNFIEIDQSDDHTLDQDQTIKLEYEYDRLQHDDNVIEPNKMDEPTGGISYVSNYRNELHIDDADLCFFRSLIPHMKELCPQKRMELRIKIHELVYKEVYSNQDNTCVRQNNNEKQ